MITASVMKGLNNGKMLKCYRRNVLAFLSNFLKLPLVRERLKFNEIGFRFGMDLIIFSQLL